LRGIDVTLRNVSKYHIDVDVKEENRDEWRFIGVYGESHTEHKDRAWQTLRSLILTPIKPWLMAGDCNKILFSHENQGGGNEVSSVWRNS